ncbi:MAG: isoprenylcysteine carboxylmethyltransferase family protein [Gammaproteobacteria bacterium]|nr:isoprenylcysteine carboxylmethyltransferase family protein [Gammaproteobacteria bacterium]MDH3449721.1 isoprenylcysteine carboxylmethyltransferase family protein [Gammaproteobacteria bacterium]
MTAEDKNGPGLKFPPPLLVLAAVGVAALVDWISPLPISERGAPWVGGAVVIALALLIAVVALAHFIGAKTHVEPWHPTTTVIQSGIYRFSRNPIYLAFCIATVGAGLILNSWWVVASAALLKFLLQVLVIRREEAYLEAKFGASYLQYKRRVRRWL